MLWWRTALQWLFAGFMLLYSGLVFIFWVPIVTLLERLPQNHRKSKIAVITVLVGAAFLLTGCTSTGVANRANTIVNRASEFSQDAPPVPYEAAGSPEQLAEAADAADLVLSGDQLSLILGAAEALSVDAVLLGYVVETELRGLDENELDRDVLGALAGEDTSVGIAQVRVSTAREIEQEDRWDLFPSAENSDQAHTARVKRLAADGWSVLYAVAYLSLLSDRYPDDGALDLAVRYTGASPQNGTQNQELFDSVERVLAD